MKSKKGQSLPMNTIVIAAIVLIVLVVIVMIFTGSMGNFVKGLKKDCFKDLGGVCGNFKCDSPAPEGSIPITGTNCEAGNTKELAPYCCIEK